MVLVTMSSFVSRSFQPPPGIHSVWLLVSVKLSGTKFFLIHRSETANVTSFSNTTLLLKQVGNEVHVFF